MTGIAWLARRIVPQVIFYGVRPVGRFLPISVLRSLSWPAVTALSLLELLYLGPTFADFDRLAAPLRPARRRWAWRLGVWRDRSRINLGKLFNFWSDRWRDPRWARLCRFEGPDASWETIAAATRPTILVALHFGPSSLLYYWFRSRRVPIAVLVALGETQRPLYRQRLLQLCDRAAGLEAIPRLFVPSQLREAADFLRENRVLLVFVSAASGRQLEVSDGGVRLLLSPGALQLAAIVDAVVIPCSIHVGRHGAMTVSLGDAVPQADVSDRGRHRAVCERLLRFYLPVLRSYPGQIDPWLLQRLRASAGPTSSIATPEVADPALNPSDRNGLPGP